MTTEHRRYVKIADKHREKMDFEEAGDFYGIAGYHALASSWARVSTSDAIEKGPIADSIVDQQYAATCYRLGEKSNRCKNRSKQAILLLADLRDRVFDHDAWIGLTYELEGDFHVIGSLKGNGEAYSKASDYYQKVESATDIDEIIAWTDELGFDSNFRYFIRVLRALGRDIDDETITAIGSHSLVERIEYKEAELPALLDSLEENGTWHWDNT